jgi:hypothetical protein
MKARLAPLASMLAMILPAAGLAADTLAAATQTVHIASLCLKAEQRCALPVLDEQGRPVDTLTVDNHAGQDLPATDLGNGMLLIRLDGRQLRISRMDVKLRQLKQPATQATPCIVTPGVRASGC